MNTSKENNTHIFPPDSVLNIPQYISIKTYKDQGIDDIYIGMITVDYSNYKDFLEKNNLKECNKKNVLFNSSFKEIEWWKPENGTVVYSCSYAHDKWVKEITVTKDATIYTIYYQVYNI